MPDQLENNLPDATRPELPTLNFLELMKPEKRAPNAASPTVLTLEHAKTIEANVTNWSNFEMMRFMLKMNSNDRDVAIAIRQRQPGERTELTEESFAKLKTEVAQTAELKNWFKQNPGLDKKFRLTPDELLKTFGPKPITEYRNFVELMGRLGNPRERIQDHYQVDCNKVFLLSQSPLRHLPDHVLMELLRSRNAMKHNLTSLPEREVSRVIPALKGWAVDPTLSFESAEKIGKLTPIERIAATVKLEQITKDGGISEQSVSSDKFFDELKKDVETNREQVLKSFTTKLGNSASVLTISDLQKPRLQLLTELILPEQKPAIQQAIASGVLAKLRPYGTEDPIQMLKQINPKVFEILHGAEKANGTFGTGYGGATRVIDLSFLFKTEAQLMEFCKTRSMEEITRVADNLQFSTPQELDGLAEWLLKKPDPLSSSIHDDSRAIEMWSHLTPMQRKMGRTELAKLANDVIGSMDFDADHYGSQNMNNFKVAFAAVDRYPDLQRQDRDTLIEVCVKQPAVLDTLRAEQLPDALKGWAIDVDFPTEIAMSVGKNKALWQQAAAKLAWREVSNAPVDRSKRIEMFPEQFELIKAAGKVKVLIQLGDPHLAAASMFPTIDSDCRESLARACLASTADEGNPVRHLVGIQCGAFRDALDSFRAAAHGQNLAWHEPSALALVSTFGKEWKQWLEKQATKNVNTHDATFWLPQASPKQNEGLKDWLFKNADRPNDKLAVVATRWSELSNEQRKLPFGELVDLAKSVQYLNLRDENFAKENAKWSVTEQHYLEREKRYLISRDTPSPFPLQKAWESGNLTGYFLPRNDPRGLYMGQHTGCCQHPDNAGGSSAWHGQESPDGGFFVIVDKNQSGKIIAGSWAWVSDNGGLCFDSIESISVSGREKQVAEIYKKAATDLAASKFHTVTTSTTGQFNSLSAQLPDCPAAKQGEALALPSNYKAYTDVTPQNQVILAKNDLTPKRTDLEKQYWVRGATESDSTQINRLAKRIYPPDWQFVPEGNLEIVLDTREHGAIGYAVLDTETKQVNDLAVLDTQKSKSPVLLRAVLKQIAEVGGEWSCSARTSTSYELLKLAEKRGLIKIHSAQADGTMNGEPMYAVRFTATPDARQAGNSSSKPSLERNNAQPKDKPVTPLTVEIAPRIVDATAAKQLTEKTVSELKKQITSAVELVSSTRPDADKGSISALSHESFSQALEVALTKVKNSPEIPSEDLVQIDALQEALNKKAPADLARIAMLQVELAAKPGQLPVQIATSATLTHHDQSPARIRAPITPPASVAGGPGLTTLVENANKGAATDKTDGTSKATEGENEKGTATKTGVKAKTQEKLKTAAKSSVRGTGVVVGIFTILESGLQGYEKLTGEK